MAPPFAPHQTRDSFADALASVTLLVRGTKQQGGKYWAYIAVKPNMLSEFSNAKKGGMFDLEEFGAILEFGDEEHPPHDVIERMHQMYGMALDKEMEILKQLE